MNDQHITDLQFPSLEHTYWADPSSSQKFYLKFYEEAGEQRVDKYDHGEIDPATGKSKRYWTRAVEIENGNINIGTLAEGRFSTLLTYQLWRTDSGDELREADSPTVLYHRMEQVVSCEIVAKDYNYTKQTPTVVMPGGSSGPTATADTISVEPGKTLLLRYDIRGQGAFAETWIRWIDPKPSAVSVSRLSDMAVLIFDHNREKEADESYRFVLQGTTSSLGGTQDIDPTIVNKGTSSHDPG